MFCLHQDVFGWLGLAYGVVLLSGNCFKNVSERPFSFFSSPICFSWKENPSILLKALCALFAVLH